jgi:glycosyltransferase involved in cell wall biosynthesis
MLISIITVCFNSEKTIRSTIESVINQNYSEIEYIIVDGGSTDNTLNIIKEYESRIHKLVSEKDKGMYDAINKGIKISSGGFVGILNSDDEFYSNDTVCKITNFLENNPQLDAIYGDIIFENKGKTIRHYRSNNWNKNKFEWGFMPPHPSFYCKRDLFFKLGFYRLDFEIASDYELLIRYFRIFKINFAYLPIIIVKMKLGGKSTKNILANIKLNIEIKKACELNGLSTNYFKLISKYFIKIFEFI